MELTYKVKTPAEVYVEAELQLLGSDELELDDEDKYVPTEQPLAARFSPAEDGSGCWIQVWMWIPNEEADEDDSNDRLN